MQRLVAISSLVVFTVAISGAQVYKDPKASIDVRVKDLLKHMTTAEKVAQLRSDSDPAVISTAMSTTGFGFNIVYRDRGATPKEQAQHINDSQQLAAKSRLGIPNIPWEEALHGLLLNGHTSFPQSIGMAATWDPNIVAQCADATAKETRAEGVRQVLSPVINVVRDARWGRVEETYGEDPYLTSKMGVAFVKSFEDNGIVTTPKHYVANLWDGGRDSNSVHISESQLREIYMEPFRAVVQEGGARSLMCSYNAVNGVPCADDHWLLTDVLRGEWGFHGYVISDYGAAGNVFDTFHQSATAEGSAALLLNAGMEVEAPGIYLYGKPLEDAVASGQVSQKVLDQAVGRVLRVKFELGLFDNPIVDPDAAAAIANSKEHQQLALEAARKVMVLLKNDHNVLPLAKSGRIAVFGDIANDKTPLGGYSGEPGTEGSILQGLKDHAPNVQFDFVPGCSSNPQAALPAVSTSALRTPDGQPGLKAEFFPNMTLSGTPNLTRIDPTVDFDWHSDAPAPGYATDNFSIRWSGTLTAPEDGTYSLSLTTDDGGRLFIGDQLVANNWSDHPATTVVAHVPLKAGVPVTIRVEYYENGGDASAKLGWQKDTAEDAILSAAKQAAAAADVSIVFAGIVEGEGQDRAYLDLPGNQEAIINAAAASGKPVIVVLVAGSPVTMEKWGDKVPAILDAWYPGQEGPAAIAETLFGDNNPGGKLPMTFPKTIGQCPLYYNYEPSGRGYGYNEIDGNPLFAFGHGLSYTAFSYSNFVVKPGAKEGTYDVSVDVKNAGTRTGDEVVQLYIHQQVSSVIRPFKELKGFERVSLQPGATTTVNFSLGFKELSILNRQLKRVVEPGKFDIMVGSASDDIRGTVTIDVK